MSQISPHHIVRPKTVQPAVSIPETERSPPPSIVRYSHSDVTDLNFHPTNGQDTFIQAILIHRANSYAYTPKPTNRETSWAEHGDNSMSVFPMLSASRTCAICGALLVDQSKVTVPQCEHMYCKVCIVAYLERRVQDGEVLKMPCPTFECMSSLGEEQLQTLLTVPVFEKYMTFKRNQEIESNPKIRHCPKPDCPGYAEGDVDNTQLICNSCNHKFCFYCQESWHGSKKCNRESDRQLDFWAKANKVKFCPNCHRRVEKMSGCDHMTCVKCRYDWCWQCGQEFTKDHLEVCEVSRSRKRNPPWLITFGLLLAPVLLPFAFVISVLFYMEQLLRDAGYREDNNGCVNAMRKRWLSYPILIVLCLVLTPLAFLVVLMFGGSIVMIECRATIDDSEHWCCRATKKRWVWVIISIFVGLWLSPVVAVVVAVGVLAAHVAGVLFMVFKLYIGVRRCFDPKYYKPHGAPGYLL